MQDNYRGLYQAGIGPSLQGIRPDRERHLLNHLLPFSVEICKILHSTLSVH